MNYKTGMYTAIRAEGTKASEKQKLCQKARANALQFSVCKKPCKRAHFYQFVIYHSAFDTIRRRRHLLCFPFTAPTFTLFRARTSSPLFPRG